MGGGGGGFSIPLDQSMIDPLQARCREFDCIYGIILKSFLTTNANAIVHLIALCCTGLIGTVHW
jgi:hypothetical protein